MGGHPAGRRMTGGGAGSLEEDTSPVPWGMLDVRDRPVCGTREINQKKQATFLSSLWARKNKGGNDLEDNNDSRGVGEVN